MSELDSRDGENSLLTFSVMGNALFSLFFIIYELFGQIRFDKTLLTRWINVVVLFELFWKSKGIWDKFPTVSKMLLFVGLIILIVDCDSVIIKLWICYCDRILEFWDFVRKFSDHVWPGCFSKFFQNYYNVFSPISKTLLSIFPTFSQML